MAPPRKAAAALVAALVAGGLVAQPEPADARRRGGARQKAKKVKKPKVATYPIRVETIPAGATVYLGDKESGPAGVTPLELTLPAGDHIVILELDGHLPRFENISVEAGTQVQTFAYELEASVGRLSIAVGDGVAVPEGTQVLIDGEERGAPPLEVELEIGAHQLQVVAPGREPPVVFEDWVEVAGGEQRVELGAEQLGIAAPAPTPKRARRKASGPVGTARAGVEVGFRRFRYQAPVTPNLRDYDGAGNVLATIEVELHPWRRYLANPVLDRLTVVAGAGYAPTIAASTEDGMELNAYWRSQHAALRVTALARRRLDVDIEAGWVHTLYTFRDDELRLVDEVPDVDYQVVRLGARVMGHLGDGARPPYDLWLAADNRIVVSGGAVEDRFRQADLEGMAARIGAAAWFLDRHLEARVEGSVVRYGYTFTTEDGDDYIADGGSDLLAGVSITVGGSF